MKYFCIYSDGQEEDKEIFNRVRGILKVNADRYLLESKEECLELAERITAALPEQFNLSAEWLNGWDDPMQEAVVFSVARSKTLPYSIGYLLFYKVRTKGGEV